VGDKEGDFLINFKLSDKEGPIDDKTPHFHSIRESEGF
jgi:hypothetical protein